MTQRTIDLVEMLLKQAGYKQEGQMYVHHTLKSAFSVQELFPKPECPTIPSVSVKVYEVNDLQKQVRGHISQDNLYDWHEALSENEMTYLENLLLTFCPLFPPGSIGFQEQKKHVEKYSVGIGLVEQLRRFNPWIEGMDGQHIHDFRTGYNRAVSTLRELIEAKQAGKSDGDNICKRCGRKNPLWSAENELFNSVNGSPDGVMCPTCFGEMAEQKGIDVYFRATSKIPPAPLSGSIKEQAKVWAEKNYDPSYSGWKTLVPAFIAGHNSQPSVQVLVDALDKILYMKREPGEQDDKYAFNRCWHLANDALQQFNTGEEKL